LILLESGTVNMLLTVVTKTADILGNPSEPEIISNNDSQLLYGEQFQVEEEHGAYVYGYSVIDGYKGFVERVQLIKNAPVANSLIHVRASHLYLDPDFKSRPTTRLSFLSRLSTTDKKENGFTQLQSGEWVFSDHLSPLKNYKIKTDLADTAQLFLNAPYLYAGRSSFGIDCSGLLQMCLIAHGLENPPRDTKDQQGTFGKTVSEDKIQRNDIVFFDGHVGIMMDNKKIINATARHLSTVIEDLSALKKAYGNIQHIARL